MWLKNDISVLQGKTLAKVTEGDDEIIFETVDGEMYRMYHDQDCCESVYVESVVGDWADLINTPVLSAAENDYDPPELSEEEKRGRYVPDSETWTFYTIRTIKGTVDIRWYGSSNGYYSERVDFVKIN